jgi:outer membrane receptor protein involved in Fe transport
MQNVLALNRIGVNQTSDLLVNTKLTYIFNPEFLVEGTLSYGDNRNKNFDPDYEDNVLLYYDSLANSQRGYENTFKNYTDQYEVYNLYGFPFRREGTQGAGYRKDSQVRFGAAVDFTLQAGRIHELKFGGTYDAYTLRQYDVDSRALLNAFRLNPDLSRTPGEDRDFYVRRNSGSNDAIGYDLYGNKVDDPNSPYAPKEPMYFAFYLQDKIEYSDLTVNAGLRFDYMDNDDFKFIDDPTTPNVIEGENNPSIDGDTKEWRETGIGEVDPFTTLSPRLGFAFPVTDRTVFHVQWGKFVQAPRIRDIFNTRGYWAEVFDGKNAYLNPFGFNLEPERTTQYELGFTQQLTDAAAFDITAYYKDIKGQIQVSRVVTTAGATASGYNKLVNGDFATTKGVELSFRLRRTARITAQVNYTLAVAKGTGSTTNAAVASIENGTLFPTVISPLDFEQAHRGAINVDYRFDRDDGGPILERLGLNILFTFNSGHPFTYSKGSIGQQGVELGALVENDARNSIPLEAVNSSTTPWNFNVDARLDKSVTIGPIEANFYIYVQNLLNTQNVLNVYRRSGNAADDGYLSNPDLSGPAVAQYGQGYVDMFQAMNLGLGQHYQAVVGQPLWGTPRQLRFGVRLEI